MEASLRAVLPDTDHPARVVDYALSDPHFYVRNRCDTRARSLVAHTLMPKILAQAELTDRELLLALGERACFDALHRGRVGTH